MEEKKKNNLLIILGIITLVLVITIGIAYAMYNLAKTGNNTTLISGDIYMRYKETTGLTLEGAMPSITYDNTKYFEFDIIGKNTSSSDVWYEIVLTDGDKPSNKNTKLDDKFLRFTLFKGNTKVVDGASYSDITNQRLYTETVDANTNNETTTTYKLYMWIDNNLKLGNTSEVDYNMTEWNDIYAAVKVNVNARTETNHSCFTLSNKDDTNHTATISAYDATCGGTDIIIPKVIDGYTITEFGSAAFYKKGITNVIIQEGVITIGPAALNSNQLTSVVIPNSVTKIEMAAFTGNQLANVTIGNNVTTIGAGSFSHNRLTSLKIPNSVTTIDGGAFEYNQLTNVTIGNGITTIGNNVFPKGGSSTVTNYNNIYYQNPNLTSITINKSCNDVRNNLLSDSLTNNKNYYPWLNGRDPFTGPGSYASGTTIYGAGGEICDAY